MHFSFRTKIFITLIALILLTIIPILQVVQAITKKQIEENFALQFQQTLAAFQHAQKLQVDFVQDEIQSLTRTNSQFRTILSTASMSDKDLGFTTEYNQTLHLADANLRLQSIAPSLSLFEKNDIFMVMNPKGQLLYTKNNEEDYGINLSSLIPLEDFLRNESHISVWDKAMFPDNSHLIFPPNSNHIYKVIGTPIIFQDSIHGYVIAGKKISLAEILSLKSITDLEVVLYRKQNIVLSTLPEQQSESLKKTFFNNKQPQAVSFDEHLMLNGVPYIFLLSEIIPNLSSNNIGFLILKSLQKEQAFLQQIRFSLLLSAGILLSLFIFIGFMLSKGISRPVAILTKAAQKIGEGDFNTKVDIKTQDEFQMLGTTFNDMVTGLKERAFLKDTFERYVSKEIAQEIIKNPSMVRLGGDEKEISIFFADIGGFTAISERLQPEEVVFYLNEFFETVTAIIINNQGTLNQYQGDAILAFWGAPLDDPKHATKATLAGLQAATQLKKLKESWLKIGLPIKNFRIGINSGMATVGNIGSSTRLNYSAHGDHVNLASRIEGANKFYGTSFLISENTQKQCHDEFLTREIDMIHVVGKENPVRVYEPLCLISDKTEQTAAIAQHFEAGLRLYRSMAWEEAINAFNAVLEIAPEDTPSKIFIQRIQHFRASPPPSNWDGTFELTGK